MNFRPACNVKSSDVPVLNKYSKTGLAAAQKVDKMKILMTKGSLMKVESLSIAECSRSILQYF